MEKIQMYWDSLIHSARQLTVVKGLPEALPMFYQETMQEVGYQKVVINWGNSQEDAWSLSQQLIKNIYQILMFLNAPKSVSPLLIQENLFPSTHKSEKLNKVPSGY